ncbi:polyprenyl synthetase family protein [Streptomyces sp. NPDC046909]|uniref:polyprenyl synthetase family protein n=1 Tax=Streptomyces sp. NPDC046909 TaxID=3155617 RepID=UPI00340ADB1A
MTLAPPSAHVMSIRHRRLRSRLQKQLAAVENVLAESVKSEQPLLADAAQHLLAAGGKRFRPVLVLLTARFGDPDTPGVIRGAAALELTHLASLYHDDVMDAATTRRGRPSVNAVWGDRTAIRTGDFLLARAVRLTFDLGDDAARARSGMLVRLAEGQALELQGPGPDDDPIRHHLDVISGKTGSLIAAAAQIGAMLAGADASTVEQLAEFGEHMGVVFQLVDDLIDIDGGVPAWGKEVGTDLRQGVSTLPVLILRSLPPDPGDADDVRLRTLLDGNLEDGGQRTEALRLLRRHRAFALARAEVAQRTERALRTLRNLPRCDARDALEDLCRAITERAARQGASPDSGPHPTSATSADRSPYWNSDSPKRA